MRWFSQISAHYKLIILSVRFQNIFRHSNAYAHRIQINMYIHFQPAFTDFSLSRISVKANLYFLNSQVDYNRQLNDKQQIHTHAQRKWAKGCTATFCFKNIP